MLPRGRVTSSPVPSPSASKNLPPCSSTSKTTLLPSLEHSRLANPCPCPTSNPSKPQSNQKKKPSKSKKLSNISDSEWEPDTAGCSPRSTAGEVIPRCSVPSSPVPSSSASKILPPCSSISTTTLLPSLEHGRLAYPRPRPTSNPSQSQSNQKKKKSKSKKLSNVSDSEWEPDTIPDDQSDRRSDSLPARPDSSICLSGINRRSSSKRSCTA